MGTGKVLCYRCLIRVCVGDGNVGEELKEVGRRDERWVPVRFYVIAV